MRIRLHNLIYQESKQMILSSMKDIAFSSFPKATFMHLDLSVLWRVSTFKLFCMYYKVVDRSSCSKVFDITSNMSNFEMHCQDCYKCKVQLLVHTYWCRHVRILGFALYCSQGQAPAAAKAKASPTQLCLKVTEWSKWGVKSRRVLDGGSIVRVHISFINHI